MLTADTYATAFRFLPVIVADLRDDEIIRERVLDSSTPWEELALVMREAFPDAKLWAHVPRAWHAQVLWFLRLEDDAARELCKRAERCLRVRSALECDDWERVAECAISR